MSGVLLAQLVLGVLGVAADHRRVRQRHDPGDVRRGPAPAPRAVGEAAGPRPRGLRARRRRGRRRLHGGQAIFASKGVAAAPGDPHVARALLGAPLYLATIAALGLGIGAAAPQHGRRRRHAARAAAGAPGRRQRAPAAGRGPDRPLPPVQRGREPRVAARGPPGARRVDGLRRPLRLRGASPSRWQPSCWSDATCERSPPTPSRAIRWPPTRCSRRCSPRSA